MKLYMISYWEFKSYKAVFVDFPTSNLFWRKYSFNLMLCCSQNTELYGTGIVVKSCFFFCAKNIVKGAST